MFEHLANIEATLDLVGLRDASIDLMSILAGG
jgi:hypothetical protein